MMSTPGDDPIAAFYDRHPYPPPVDELDRGTARGDAVRVEHHRIWSARDPASVRSVLVAGCGTSQAVRHALDRPDARVVAIDVSETAIEHTRRLANRHGVTNLELRRVPIEELVGLEASFDHVVCTGVLHHLADPVAGLSRLREVLAPDGAITLMVYARYGRIGVHLFQEYCRLLGVGSTTAELHDLVATLREIPSGHPLDRLLRASADFRDDHALADALLNPRDRAYSVPELFELLDAAGLRFRRWAHQAPYLPHCGSVSETPHASRIQAMEPADQFAAMELFRGTITRHTVIAVDRDDRTSTTDFSDASAPGWVPVRPPTATVVSDPGRLPPGVAAALLNRAHTDTDLVMFVDRRELAAVEAIDGRRTIADLGDGALALVERLWRHDLVVIDATSSRAP